MLDISAFTSPLSGMSHMKVWMWGPLHKKCFVGLKSIACKSPILKPIDYKKAKQVGEHIFLICDASISGIGAYYSQGTEWQTCHPAGFLSKKFSSAQLSYRTYKQETLAILEGLLHWEDKLLGCEIIIITDHHMLEFFNTQWRMSLHQIHWYEYLSWFIYMINYVEGVQNVIADVLSHMYAGQNDSILIDDWVNADVCLDPNSKTLPLAWLLESHVMHLHPCGAHSALLKERPEPCIIKSQELQEPTEQPSDPPVTWAGT
jgi:hypothetical protein